MGEEDRRRLQAEYDDTVRRIERRKAVVAKHEAALVQLLAKLQALELQMQADSYGGSPD